ncbi:hypothetical protein [Roseomonas populi]|uniref:Uncharacterized protein n=1 Tax=Roseomonas populi TaxID=3121582 RepID=A0ABT1XBE7_9PROT|nr:hypothetical protein [Roseomonas pecuniae]MCR0985029.1 hypothetical protein [Roseomonas pecuniae]
MDLLPEHRRDMEHAERVRAAAQALNVAMLAAAEDGLIVVVEVLGQNLGEDVASEARLAPTVSVVVERA